MAPASVVTVPAGVREDQLHNLPIKLTHNATAAQLTEKWNPDAQQAYLRGRLLRGMKVQLPEGYTGLVVRSSGSQTDECQRQWTAASEFSSFMVWAHDVAPGPSDPIRRTLEWCTLSNPVHVTVSLEEVEAELREAQAAAAPAPAQS
ncbi:hypothetical protein PLESTB_000007400 [Pleodorina starrii]|uniref:Uncharacterized protein n=1 Tax=Pleodorina starrii TaxID=330485 RepID=A0A9W6B9W9_9CHLO|nr:hypothetical protein PLESTB_000007400 [Pleodorina starrii]GLC75624.1 hypothetical protein PLESTF_001666400 [Pleodorina starrii]